MEWTEVDGGSAAGPDPGSVGHDAHGHESDGFLVMAKGRFGTLFLSQIVLAVTSPVVYLLVVPYGVRAVAWSAVWLMVGNTAVLWKAFYWDSIRLRFGTGAGR